MPSDPPLTRLFVFEMILSPVHSSVLCMDSSNSTCWYDARALVNFLIEDGTLLARSFGTCRHLMHGLRAEICFRNKPKLLYSAATNVLCCCACCQVPAEISPWTYVSPK
eukprot:5191953-Pleurochrysis_carterae.AAC.1